MRHLIRKVTTAHRRSTRMSLISGLALTFVAGLTLLMPVSYRAGTDEAHAHATFQLWIDAATGRSHHHHGAGDTQWQVEVVFLPALLSPAEVALESMRTAADHATHAHHSHGDTHGSIVVGDAPATQQPDSAEPMTSHMPVQHATAPGVLGALIALLLVGARLRPRWTDAPRLAGIPACLEPPPPRTAPC
jgi:hypothetical protein